MSLYELNARYGTEAQCEQAGWPEGCVCPECREREHSRFVADERRYWQCSTCGSQSRVVSGTLFHACEPPLTTGCPAPGERSGRPKREQATVHG